MKLRGVYSTPDLGQQPKQVFDRATVDALHAAIAVHDTVDLSAVMPARVPLDYGQALISGCYFIALQAWQDVNLTAVARVAARLAMTGRLSQEDTLTLKASRASAKQLRFAYGTLSATHHYPGALDRLTRYMGQAQDAVKSGSRWKAAIRGILLVSVCSRWARGVIEKELRGFVVVTPGDLNAYILNELEGIRKSCVSIAMTDKRFHETRKSVSRLVAFFDAVVTISPTLERRMTCCFLSTINGLMGKAHDEMVCRKRVSRRSYAEVSRAVSPAIIGRLHCLVSSIVAV